MANLMLDSGAFSAHQNGTVVDVYAYIDYIKESGATFYMNLDVIASSEKSWINQKIMEKEGLSPIPIFHANSNVKYLQMCMEYDYMAIGGMASGSHESARESFLDACFTEICNTPDHLPCCKVHGLGLASPLLVAKYPFFSADTASGIHYGRYGIIIIPSRNRSGKLDYLKPPHSLYITERSTAKQHEGHHFVNHSVDEKEWILNYVKEQGFNWGAVEIKDVDKNYVLKDDNERFLNKHHTKIEIILEDGIVSNGVLRDYFNIDFFMHMEAAIPEWPWSYAPKLRRMF